MIIRSLRYRRNGSAIFVAVGVLCLLLVLLGSFLKTTTSRVHTTKKIGDLMLAREFATSLAVLSGNYIKCELLRDSNSELRKTLSLPLNSMHDDAYSENFTEKFKNCIANKVKSGSENILSSLEKGSGLNKLKWDIAWYIYKGDFSPIELDGEKPFPREKEGTIRVLLKVEHVLPGTKTPITEDYLFVSHISVVANLIPVLSKFTLYVEDALNNDEQTRLNLVRTKATGDLNTNSKYRPWVLNNGEGSEIALDTYKDIVESNRGLVFLGGGTKDKPITLGIARGWNDIDAGSLGEYGEDFHFYKNSTEEEGYWKTIELIENGKGIMASDIGLCDDESDENLQAWQEQLGGYYEEDSKKNSIFKLLGTDRKKSLTLVLGFVDSLYASVRIYKSSSGDLNFLTYFDDEANYLSSVGFADEDGMNAFDAGDIADFYNATGGSMSHSDYLDKYASRLSHSPYTKDYLYILTRNNTIDLKERVNDTRLKSLAGYNSNNSDFTSVPEGYDKLIHGADLTQLSNFLDKDKLSINVDDDEKNKRIACVAKIEDAAGLDKYLTQKGFLIEDENNGKELDINGWIYVKSSSSIDAEINKYKVTSQGGIIVDEGSVSIKGDIVCDNGAHLTIVALSGNITLDASVKRCDASLIACGGQVKLLGGHNDSELTINGNVVMQKINDLEKLSRGCNLNYNEALSAMPGKGESENNRSEFPLLMFSYKDNPKMFD